SKDVCALIRRSKIRVRRQDYLGLKMGSGTFRRTADNDYTQVNPQQAMGDQFSGTAAPLGKAQRRSKNN
ncbi:MAG: hypothetical protein WBP29_12805, partial [Candidatus Zixiibacteriota bacterium]